MNKRIRIERREVERTPSGAEKLLGWVPAGTVSNPQGEYWASVEPLRGREYYSAGAQVRADMDTKIVMRVQPGLPLDPTMRVVFVSTVLGIVSVANVKEAGDMWEIMAKSGGVGDGR